MVLQPDGWVPPSEQTEEFPRKDDNLIGNKMTLSCFTYRPLWSFNKAVELDDDPSLTNLYSVLWSFSNLDFIAWPSLSEIVERSGMAESFVVSGVEILESQGLIYVHIGLLDESRPVIDLGDTARDSDSVRLLLCHVPRKIRPSLIRTSRN